MGSIIRNLSNERGYKKMIKREPFVAIGKKWIFDLLEVHFVQLKRTILTDIRKRIIGLDRAGPEELGKRYRTPGDIRGCC